LEILDWVEGNLPLTAKRFKPRKGLRKWMVELEGGSLVEMESRAAVYAATYSRGIQILEYDSSASTLSMTRTAPLPADLARSVALCDGRLPHQSEGRIVFDGVRWSVASLVLALTGQPLPITHAEKQVKAS
jgi:hypothetical protein